MNKEEYAQKLLNPQWRRKRLEILERDNYKCRACGDGDNILHVHHKYYIDEKDPWDYDNSSLMTLCDACHCLHHELLKLNSKDYPPLFLPKFKQPVRTVWGEELERDDYYAMDPSVKKIPWAIRRQYFFILKLIEVAKDHERVSFHVTTRLAKNKLNDMCIRANCVLITDIGMFGDGDVTDLKPEQYL